MSFIGGLTLSFSDLPNAHQLVWWWTPMKFVINETHHTKINRINDKNN